MTDPIAIYAEAPAIAEINALEVEADRDEASASDTRWQQAERVVSLLEVDGWTQQGVADSWRRVNGETYTQRHVSYVAKTWHTFQNLGSKRPRWNEAYHSPEVRGTDPHVTNNSGDPEWYTNADLIAAARQVLGGIDLDPASSDIAQQVVCAGRYFTVDNDGLAQDWSGRVWMNPPYTARLIDRFVFKLLEHHATGDVPAAIVLTNNSTDTGWWQALADRSTAVCHLRGRRWFYSPDGETGSPLQGQTLCYLGDDPAGFEISFSEFGVVR